METPLLSNKSRTSLQTLKLFDSQFERTSCDGPQSQSRTGRPDGILYRTVAEQSGRRSEQGFGQHRHQFEHG